MGRGNSASKVNGLTLLCMALMHEGTGPKIREAHEARGNSQMYEFDSTLGYPGEGPSRKMAIMGWNCGGAKSEDRITKMVLTFANRRNDVEMFQELHLNEREAKDAEMLARQLGHAARFSARSDGAAREGTGIIVNLRNSGTSFGDVKFESGADGKVTKVSIKTADTKVECASVYLPSDRGRRVEAIQEIKDTKLLTKNTILEADHNCVSQVIDAGEGGQYENAGADMWFGYLAGLGLKDEERNNKGPRAKLYTRAIGRKTRIDKFMMPEGKSYGEGWQWDVTKDTDFSGLPFQSETITRLKQF